MSCPNRHCRRCDRHASVYSARISQACRRSFLGPRRFWARAPPVANPPGRFHRCRQKRRCYPSPHWLPNSGAHREEVSMRTRSHRISIGFVLCVAALLLATQHAQPFPQTSAPLRIETLPSPAGANSSEPQLTSQGDRVILSWVEVNGERASLKFAERTPTGWSNAQTAASGNHFFINSFDVPSMHALADGSLVAHWEARFGTDEDSDASKV